MRLCSQFLRDQRVCGFLHTIVEKPVRIFCSENEARSHGFPELPMHLLTQILVNHAEHRKVGAVAEARELLQRLLRLGGQPIQLPHHKVHDVFGITLGVNAIQVPMPLSFDLTEDEQSLFEESRYELNGEKRIAGRLFLDQSRQRASMSRFTAKGICNQQL